MEVKRGTCHCGAVEFEVDLENGFEELRRCNCSMCKRRQNVVASVSINKLKVLRGNDRLNSYQFNTMTAKHYFCSICGIYTHHLRRSNRNQYGFNVSCLEGVDPYALGEIPIVDGANNHLSIPLDSPSRTCRHR